VALEDEGSKLHLLLSWCDQRCTHRSTDLSDLQSVLELADKYSMVHIITHVGDVILKLKDVIVTQPLRVFCIAARFRLRSLAHAAAMETLKLPVAEWTAIPEMNHITASTLMRLVQYYKACVDELQTYSKDVVTIWNGLNPPVSCRRGHNCSNEWYTDYMKRVAEALEKRPSVDSLDHAFLLGVLETTQSLSCTSCRVSAPWHVVFIQQHLIKEIQQKISQVSCFYFVTLFFLNFEHLGQVEPSFGF
jgi:hypothetical protein